MMQMQRFDGYGVLITGAGQGIGAATARRFGEEGARVLVTDLDAGHAEKTAAAIPGALPLVCDARDGAAVEAAVAYAVREFGSLDVVVNNAYSCTPDAARFEDQDDESWNRDLEGSLTSAFRVCRAALPHLEAAGGRGAIVNVGSVNAEVDFGNHAYSAAKAGLASLTRTLAGNAAPRGVRVNVVEPGTIRTGAGRAARTTWRTWRASTRWAGSASPRTSRRRSPSSPRATRRGSRGRRCGSTAASSRSTRPSAGRVPTADQRVACSINAAVVPVSPRAASARCRPPSGRPPRSSAPRTAP